ncbi:MAG: glycosyltransferase family 4 protein [Flavobacteriales bacterium]|nr:glycosyltransferase family 4 protein [Flavobacteriales bacterium]
MKKIAVLLDGSIASDGRVQRTVKSLSNYFKIDLFYCDPTPKDDDLFDSQNIKLIPYKLKESWFINNFKMHKKFPDLFEKVIQGNVKYDIIYSNDYPLLHTAVRLKLQIGAKLVYDSHEIYISTINQFFPQKGFKGILYGKALTLINRFFHSKIELKNISYVDGFITVCDSFLDYFKNKYDIKNGVVLKNCPDILGEIPNTDKLRKQLKLTSDDKILLYQGVLNPGRGVENILNSASMFNENIHFVIIGGGPQELYLRNLAKKLSLKNTHFLGRVPFLELLNYTASADVGILLIEPINISKALTLPNKVFEYMVASIPFITNKLIEGSKIVNEEKCGYIIDDSSSIKIASGINNVFSNFDKSKGNNGFNAIQAKYNWKTEFVDSMNMIKNL